MKINVFKIFAFTFFCLSVWSCEESNPTPEPNKPDAELKADAGADQNVLPTRVTTLSGSASTGSSARTFGWKILKKPFLSQVQFDQANKETCTFTPDIVGFYEIELTVSDKGLNSTDKITVKAEYTEPVVLDKAIKTNTRLFDRFIDVSKADYIVTKDVQVLAGLDIDRGVHLTFERDKGMSIEESGAITAMGSDEQRIRFTGKEAGKGSWAGIKLFSPSSTNAFVFVDVEQGGGKIAFSNTKAGIALFGNNKTQVSLENCRFFHNDGFGLYVQNGSVLKKFVENAFQGQTEAGILIDAYNATVLDSKSHFTGGNGRDVVEISSSDIKGTQHVTWPSFADKTPYRLLGNMAVETGWTLQPGVTIEAARDAMISINRTGYLSAKGNETRKVVFTGVSKNTAYWRGLIFYSTSNENEISNAEITGGGSSVIVSGQRAAVTVYGKGARLNIHDSKINHSGGHAIMSSSDAELNANAVQSNTYLQIAQKNIHQL